MANLIHSDEDHRRERNGGEGSNNNNSRLIGSWKKKKKRGRIRRKEKNFRELSFLRFCRCLQTRHHRYLNKNALEGEKKKQHERCGSGSKIYTHATFPPRTSAVRINSSPALLSLFYGGIRKQSAIVKINLGGGGGRQAGNNSPKEKAAREVPSSPQIYRKKRGRQKPAFCFIKGRTDESGGDSLHDPLAGSIQTGARSK